MHTNYNKNWLHVTMLIILLCNTPVFDYYMHYLHKTYTYDIVVKLL